MDECRELRPRRQRAIQELFERFSIPGTCERLRWRRQRRRRRTIQESVRSSEGNPPHALEDDPAVQEVVVGDLGLEGILLGRGAGSIASLRGSSELDENRFVDLDGPVGPNLSVAVRRRAGKGPCRASRSTPIVPTYPRSRAGGVRLQPLARARQ